MSYFTHIFNTSFFIILAIILLLVAVIVIYFESKMREHNHKFVSMLSLVSTLAEDMNDIKLRLNHLIISGGDQNKEDNSENLGIMQNNTLNIESNALSHNKHISKDNLVLIEVSDDDSTDDDQDDDQEHQKDEDQDDISSNDNDETNDNEENSSDDEENEMFNEAEFTQFNIDDIHEDTVNDNREKNNIKVLVVNLLNNNNLDMNCETKLDLDDFEELDNFKQTDEVPEIAEEYTKEKLSLKYEVDSKEIKQNDKNLEEKKDENILDSIKTISINLGDEQPSKDDIMDYKKIQLPKLRTILVEKGLASNLDALKLKKNEILKMLGVE